MNEVDEQELRLQIEEEIKLQYKVRFDQMKITSKLKVNEAKNYYENKLKVCTQQANEVLLNMQKDNNDLNEINLKLKKKLKKIKNNEIAKQNAVKNTRSCGIFWKGQRIY